MNDTAMLERSVVQSGYMIVKTFETLYDEHVAKSPLDHPLYSIPYQGGDMNQIRHRYRGTDREPLSGACLEILGRWLRQDPTLVGLPTRAATLGIDVLERQDKSQSDVIMSLEDVRDIYTLLGRRVEWEIIWQSRTEQNAEPPPYTRLLGYESTYSGAHFSALCDCMCFPRWHGTDQEGTLFAPYYALLNENALFDTAGEASQFLQFYLSQDWTEKGYYSVTEVRALSEDLNRCLLSQPRYVFLDTHVQAAPGYTQDPDSVPQIPGLTWDITLQASTGYKMVGIKALLDLTHQGLCEAMTIVESLPVVLRILYVGEKERLVGKLATAGFVFQIQPHF